MTTADTTASPPPADGALELERLRSELAAALEETAKYRELAARAQADVQNARGRMEREAADARAYASEAVLRALLPTIDSFQRAAQHLPEALSKDEWVKGMLATEQQMLTVFEGMGLRRMASVGQTVDPLCHDVLMTGPGAADTVTEVFEEGYELHGRILRPAKVKAGDGSAA